MTPSRARRAVPWTALVLAAAAALFFGRMRARVDTDLFFHLKDGERVVREAVLPTVERFSYTRLDRPMVATEWLSSASFYEAFRLGGYPAVAALCALLTAGALGLAARAGRGVPEPGRALLTALAAFALLSFALAKVQCWTFFLFALHLWWIRRWEEGAAWVPWAMAGSLAVWVNLHGGFMLGWGLLGAVCLRDFVRAPRVRALSPWALGTLACCLHPNGVDAFVYPLWFMFAPPAARALVTEWRPLAFGLPALPFALVFVAALVSGVQTLRRRFPWPLLVLLLAVMGLRERKMLPYFALSALAASGLAAAGARWARSKACLAGALAALLAVGAAAESDVRSLAPLGPVSDWQRAYPSGAADYVAAHRAGTRLFHPYAWGAYLMWRLGPETKVFIDGRLDPYWTLVPDYRTLIRAAPGWRDLLDRYGVETAVLPPASGLARALAGDPAWRAAGADRVSVVYVRR
jgi:hypothetical protein